MTPILGSARVVEGEPGGGLPLTSSPKPVNTVQDLTQSVTMSTTASNGGVRAKRPNRLSSEPDGIAGGARKKRKAAVGKKKRIVESDDDNEQDVEEEVGQVSRLNKGKVGRIVSKKGGRANMANGKSPMSASGSSSAAEKEKVGVDDGPASASGIAGVKARQPRVKAGQAVASSSKSSVKAPSPGHSDAAQVITAVKNDVTGQPPSESDAGIKAFQPASKATASSAVPQIVSTSQAIGTSRAPAKKPKKPFPPTGSSSKSKPVTAPTAAITHVQSTLQGEPSFLDSLFSDTIPQTKHERQLQKEREEKAAKTKAEKAKMDKETDMARRPFPAARKKSITKVRVLNMPMHEVGDAQ